MCDVSIIIVSYNTEKLLDNCIESIVKCTLGVQYEIIVVDNASSDATISMLYTKYPSVKVIALRENIGFGRANNIGVTKAEGNYLMFLNSDTVVLNNAIFYFYKNAQKNERDYIYGTYLMNNRYEYINSFSRFQTKKIILIRTLYMYFPLLLYCRNFFLKKSKEEIVKREVDFVTGADMFMKKSIFENIGGFDNNIFMYCEDEDLCRRANVLGIKCMVICEPKIIHLEGMSSKIARRKRKQIINSYVYLMKKYK